MIKSRSLKEAVEEIADTDREVDILTLLCNGRNARQVAADLGIKPTTVYMYCKMMRERTRTSSTKELVARVIEHMVKPRRKEKD